MEEGDTKQIFGALPKEFYVAITQIPPNPNENGPLRRMARSKLNYYSDHLSLSGKLYVKMARVQVFDQLY